MLLFQEAPQTSVVAAGPSVSRRRQRTIRVASTLPEAVEAWRMVYQRYLATGLIAANPYRLHTAAEAVSPGTTTICEHRGQKLRRTISCYLDSRRGVPLDAVYPTALAQARARGERLGEIGLLAECPAAGDASATRIQDLFAFMRYPIYALYHQGASQVVIGVHPRHARFYERLLGFEIAGPVVSYPRLLDRDVVLLRFDTARLDATDPAPRGLGYWRRHRLGPEAFAGRCRFDPADVAASPLAGYLGWLQAENHPVAPGGPRADGVHGDWFDLLPQRADRVRKDLAMKLLHPRRPLRGRGHGLLARS